MSLPNEIYTLLTNEWQPTASIAYQACPTYLGRAEANWVRHVRRDLWKLRETGEAFPDEESAVAVKREGGQLWWRRATGDERKEEIEALRYILCWWNAARESYDPLFRLLTRLELDAAPGGCQAEVGALAYEVGRISDCPQRDALSRLLARLEAVPVERTLRLSDALAVVAEVCDMDRDWIAPAAHLAIAQRLTALAGGGDVE